LCSLFPRCFFLTPAATTGLYTLSLHDALPICDGVGTIGGHRRSGQRVDALDQREGDVVEVDAAVDVRRRDAIAVQKDDVAGRAEDRKSTRLNSSHVKISYAVFCLKKKKKDDRQ